MLIGIVAVSRNNVIGKDNNLPFKNKEDMKLFKDFTMGKMLVMGRKTSESVGPLSGRETITLSRSGGHTIDEILALSITSDVCICGGSQIYELFMPYIDIFLVSRIDVDVDGDTSMPQIQGFKGSITIPFDTFNLDVFYRDEKFLKILNYSQHGK